jgi:hypothetical protein
MIDKRELIVKIFLAPPFKENKKGAREPSSPFFTILRVDGFAKSPSAALRRILRHCGVPLKYAAFLSPARSGIARLASDVGAR